MTTKALVIKIQGDRGICRSVAGTFESPELSRMRLENAVLRRNRDALRRLQIEALTREVEAHLYGRRVIRRVKKALWAAVGAGCRFAGRARRWAA